MSNRLLISLVLLVILGMGLLLVRPILDHQKLNQTFAFTPDLYDVRGSAIVHQGILYTLNFSQQKELIEKLKQIQPIFPKTPSDLEMADLSFSQLIFYQFNGPALTILPVGLLDGHLVFSSSDWGKDLYMESSPPTLFKTLSQAYDP